MKVNRHPGGSQAHPFFGFAAMMPNTCPQRGVVWFQNQIVDTGTPMGGMAYKGAPASFVNMIQLYQTHNIVFEKGNATLYPARNGMATGPGMQLLSCPNSTDTPVPAMMGESIGGPGGTPNQLGCPMGFRTMNVKIFGRNLVCVIDTGTPAFPVGPSLGGGRMGGQRMAGMTMATFEPNPNPSPLATFPNANDSHFCPVYWISQAVRIILTSQYTILQSLGGDGASIFYSCRGGGQSQQGDPLMGRWKM